MRDPDLCHAIKVVDRSRSMPASEAARYLFDQYRTSSAESRDAFVLAVIGELGAARGRLLSPPVPDAAYPGRFPTPSGAIDPDARG